MRGDPSTTPANAPRVVQKSVKYNEIAHDGNTGEQASTKKDVDTIMADQYTMDGVKHKLTAAADLEEGMAGAHGNVEGYEDNKVKAIYEQEHPDGSKKQFHIGGIEEGVLHMNPNGLTVEAEGAGEMGVGITARNGAKQEAKIKGAVEGGATVDMNGMAGYVEGDVDASMK